VVIYSEIETEGLNVNFSNINLEGIRKNKRESR